ncbi:MAG: radical SAM protein [Ruminococcaceae bacterium]|nr:radical SAM protein [Oscillospiraceae bacterium]
MNLNKLLQQGIGSIMKTAGRFYLNNKTGRSFLARMAPQISKSARLREQNEAAGTHIPAFLIASVASQCNLHCAGCYARAGGCCSGATAKPDLTCGEWDRIFSEASSLGVSFVLLAGGEPLTRPDVITTAARHPELIFPIFTNGTMMDEATLRLFDQNRNLIPVVSIEGAQTETDTRRGAGTHAKIETAMAHMARRDMLFGASITVTRENLHEVLQPEFLANLRNKGCGIVFYVEYVPAQAGTEALALTEAELETLNRACDTLKSRFKDMVVLSFPGDEAAMGGCLASGRGFFHISPTGDAEPCPFSPFAKHNLKDASMKEVLQSRYYAKLREMAAQAGPRTGGCVLFQRQAEVQALLAQ